MTARTEELGEPIGARLKRLRLERGMSQRELSSPGVSYAYISRIEAGARTPSVKALRMLARKLGVSVEYLETGRDVRDTDDRELRIADAELQLRLGDGSTGAATEQLRRALDEAVHAGDHVNAQRARIALGLAAAQRGNHLEAVERLEAATAEPSAPHPHPRPDVYATLAQSYAALGAPDRAVSLLDRCLEQITEAAPDDKAAQVRFAAFLSYALTDAGDYERAEDVVREALRRADGQDDPYTRVRLYWSLARLAGIEGRAAEALDNIRAAIALLKATDDSFTLARAYLLAAGIETKGGAADDARRHLDLGERLLGPTPEPVDLGTVRVGQARLALLEGDTKAAAERAREALEILGDFHGGERAAAIWALAQALAADGDDDALECYRRAVDLLIVHGRRHEAAEAAGEWARLLQERGREDEAEPIHRRAAELHGDVRSGTSQR